MQEDRNNLKKLLPGDQGKTLTPHEVGELLGISVSAVYKRLHDGRIPHVRIGKNFYIEPVAFKRWLKSLGVTIIPPLN
jgi:excisionase family DNA binding protein